VSAVIPEVSKKLLSLAGEYPLMKDMFEGLVERLDDLGKKGKTEFEISENINRLVRPPKRRRLDTLQVIARRQDIPHDDVPIKDLQTKIWGKTEDAIPFLRHVSARRIVGLDEAFLVGGFEKIDEILGFALASGRGCIALADVLDCHERDTVILFRTFGAGSFHLQRLQDVSYWAGVHQRLVLFNMGRLLHVLQVEAFNEAKDRIAAENPTDTLTLTSKDRHTTKIPVELCDVPVVHKVSWQETRVKLADAAYLEYSKLGGILNRKDYVKKVFRENIKQALLLFALYQCYGPIIVFWNALSPSRLYKTTFTEVRSSQIPPSDWSALNKRLLPVLNMKPSLTSDARKKKKLKKHLITMSSRWRNTRFLIT